MPVAFTARRAGQAARCWYPAFAAPKSTKQLAAGIAFARPKGAQLLIMRGSGDASDVVFDAIEFPPGMMKREDIPMFSKMQSTFTPHLLGSFRELDYHAISIDAKNQRKWDHNLSND